MITTCPSCSVRFLIPDEVLGAQGRKVRCGKCAHVWFQEPESSEDLPQEPVKPVKIPRPPRDLRKAARLFAYASAAVFIISVGLLAALPASLTNTWEPVARLYSTLGMPLPVLGEGLLLDGVEVHTSRAGDGYALLVHGQVVNTTAAPQAVPNILVTVRDGGKRPLLQWLASSEQKTLQPREKLLFTSQQVINNQLATSVMVRFTHLTLQTP